MNVLFLGKAQDDHCGQALGFLRANCEVEAHMGEWGSPFPEQARRWRGDLVISYLSRWIVPASVISNATKAAINFHPASPDYPGVGCINFALYNDEPEYGATCHFMLPKVDTGTIVATKRFPVFPSDDVASLLERTYDFQLVLFFEIAAALIEGKTLRPSGEKWGRKPFTRTEFEELPVIRPDMGADEVARRIRATRFGRWKPFVEIGGHKFELA